jgi:hypothetical protein
MQGYKISFNIYAESEAEATAAQQAIVGFISDHAREGRAVSATKITNAIKQWQSNPFVKNHIINYFN